MFKITGTAFAASSAEGAQGDAHTETAGAHGEAGQTHEKTFPPFDPSLFASQLVWLAITFGIFYLIMKRVALPRIGGILEMRRDRISQDLDEAQRLSDESDAAHAAYEHELAEARKRAHAIAQEARDQAKAETDAERDKVESELNEKMAAAEAQILKIKEEALSGIDEIASGTAEAIVKELIGGTVTKAELAKAVSGKAK
ncbi:MAG: F0F1 ATP synthase subunit B [Rhizobiaceae bacterium]